jgi:O-antigen/teichoic acid export membrane protein
MLVSVGAVIPQSFLRYDIAASIATFLGTANSVGVAVVVASGGGVVAVVVFVMATNVVACVLYGTFGWRLLSRLDRRAGPRWCDVRRPVLTFAALTAATRAHTVVAAQTNRIVVGIAGGTTDAAYYQVPNMLSTRVNDMLGRVAQVLFPTGTDLLARGEHDALRTLYFRSSRVFFLVNGTVTMAVCVFAAPLLRYWVGPAFAEAGAVALVVFTATQGINAITMAPGFLNLSAGRPGVNLAFSLANSIINLATVYSLTVRYGITGAALAGLLGAATVPFFMVFTHRRILHVPSLAWFRRCLAPTIVGSTVIGLAAGFFAVPLCHRLLVTLLLWAVCVLAAMAASGLLGAISREDVGTARRLAVSFVGRRGGKTTSPEAENDDEPG